MIHALGEIFRLLVAPFSLSADYSGFPHTLRLTPQVALSGAAVIGAVLAAFFARRRGKGDAVLWLAWFGLTWLPVSNLLFTSGIVIAERALYLPSVALSGIVAVGVSSAFARDRRWLVLPLIAVVGSAVLSTSRAALWLDSRTLYEETVANGRYSGHIAKTGLVAELMRELERKSDPRALARALELARASLAERPTTTNLHQVAALEERAGDLDATLERRISLYHFDPSDFENREALLRVLDRLIARRDAEGDTYEVLSLTGTGFLVAQRSGDTRLLDAWRARIDLAYQRYIDEAVEADDREEARRRIESLARVFPQHPLLERYRDY